MDGRRPSLFYRIFALIATAVVITSAVAVLAVGLIMYRISQNGSIDALATMPAGTDVLNLDDMGDSVQVSAQPIGENYTNILLIGTDREENGICRADVIMVCSIDKTNNKMLLTSFLRDLYLPIPGKADNRINASYAFGGAALLKQCLQENFGIRVDHTVEMDFEGFSAVIDALGGVELTVNEEEARYLGVKEGKNLLSGAKALEYVRMRAVGNGDFDRTQRQQKLLAAIGPRFSGADLGGMYRCVRSILSHIKSDLTFSDMLGLLPDIIAISGNKNCKSLQIPAEGTYQDTLISGMQVLVPDLGANREALDQNLG